MARLLRDRYFEYAPDQALDLVTGDHVVAGALPEEACRRETPTDALAEVLDHGRDGMPRWLVTEAVARGPDAVAAIAQCARAHGFVAIAADIYLRVRVALAEDLRERALVLVAAPTVPDEIARAALIDAAARSVRPHVLVTVPAPPARPAAAPRAGFVVREARAAYGVQPHPARIPAPTPEDVRQHVARAARAADFVRAGRHAAAERLLRDVTGALIRRRALAHAARTCVSLGRLLLERGRASAADRAFEDAAAHADAARDEAVAAAARTWQAAARTDAAQLTAAESLCRAVLLAGGVDAAARGRVEATLARVLLWQGRTEEAEALPFVDAATPECVEPVIDAIAVRVLLARHRTFDAGLRARRLLSTAEAAPDPLAHVIALAAHLRVLLAAGDLVLAEQRLAEVDAAAKEARAPLRAARMHVLWVDTLRRAGREREAAEELKYLDRVRIAAPPLLRDEIQRRLRGEPTAATVRVTPGGVGPASTSAATTLVAIVQREENDRDALTCLLEFTADALQSSRLELWSADAGPETAVLSLGSGVPTRIGARVMDAGIAIGPECGNSGVELGVPVRLGTRLLAAIAARWPADRTPPAHAGDLLALAAAVAAPRVEAHLTAGREAARAATAIPELVGISAAMTEVRRAVTRAAAAPFAVLIDGESGVGKELVARAIHQLGPRRERRFCDVNCAALPDELLESELFGHARGAFTGAVTDRAGMFEEADGGTLFLDEVADLSARAQAKLLRVLQQQEVRRVGETFSRAVDVRIVSAANRDLRAEVAAGRFRQDLLYRLEVIRIRIPPLRERPEDVALLAQHFWRAAAARVGTAATLTHAATSALARHAWPGNVRELQNVIAALAVEAPARGLVRPSLLPAAITGTTTVTASRLAEARLQFERRFVEMALARAGGSRTRAARELGLSRQGLLKVFARLGMQ